MDDRLPLDNLSSLKYNQLMCPFLHLETTDYRFVDIDMDRLVTLATCNLNQWAMDFEGNYNRIRQSRPFTND